MKPTFTIGIEEEYLLVDRESRDLVVEAPASLMKECERRLEGRVSSEFLQSQIEVGTSKHENVKSAAEELGFLRGTVAGVAEEHGLAAIAASTHPFASWDRQKHTPKDRYDALARDMQAVVRRLLICGMHVHVGLNDDDLRIDLMQQIAYFLPHLLVLSTSSPFWRGEDTGLKSYRLSVFHEMPRTGLPEVFDSYGEYRRHVNVLIGAGVIEDGTKIWWDVRPSDRFPTLEMRIADICTFMSDSLTVAAVYQSLLHMLWRLKRSNKRWRGYANMLVQENKWRAQRYGFDEGLIDFGKGEIVPYGDLLEEIIELCRESAEELGCLEEVTAARDILKRGTGAHQQVSVYEKALAEGKSKEEALKAVVDFLIEAFVPEGA